MRTSSCDTLRIVVRNRETESFSPGPRARPKGYGPWRKVELATAVRNTAVETAWSWKVIGLAQHLLCRLLDLVLHHYARVRQLGTVIASPSPVGRRTSLSVSLRPGIQSARRGLNMLLQREARREVVDGIQTMVPSSNLLFNFLRRRFVQQSAAEQSGPAGCDLGYRGLQMGNH